MSKLPSHTNHPNPQPSTLLVAHSTLFPIPIAGLFPYLKQLPHCNAAQQPPPPVCMLCMFMVMHACMNSHHHLHHRQPVQSTLSASNKPRGLYTGLSKPPSAHLPTPILLRTDESAFACTTRQHPIVQSLCLPHELFHYIPNRGKPNACGYWETSIRACQGLWPWLQGSNSP